MMLALDLPPDWQVEQRLEGGYDVVIPGARERDELTMRVGGLIVRDDNLVQWTQRTLDAELGKDIEVLRVGDGTTDLGWPIRKILVKLGAGAASSLHLYAFYHLFDYAGQVAIHAKRPALLEQHLESIDAILVRARPDFTTDQVAALAQLWM